jgi:hypothetical protein
MSRGSRDSRESIRGHRKQRARALRTGRYPRRTPANWSVAEKAAGSAGAGSRTARSRKGKRTSRARIGIFSGIFSSRAVHPYLSAAEPRMRAGGRRLSTICSRTARESRSVASHRRYASALQERETREREFVGRPSPARPFSRSFSRAAACSLICLSFCLSFEAERKREREREREETRAGTRKGQSNLIAARARARLADWRGWALIAHQVPAREIEPRRRAHSRQVLTRAWLRC